jgi:hypothetical protein
MRCCSHMLPVFALGLPSPLRALALAVLWLSILLCIARARPTEAVCRALYWRGAFPTSLARRMPSTVLCLRAGADFRHRGWGLSAALRCGLVLLGVRDAVRGRLRALHIGLELRLGRLLGLRHGLVGLSTGAGALRFPACALASSALASAPSTGCCCSRAVAPSAPAGVAGADSPRSNSASYSASCCAVYPRKSPAITCLQKASSSIPHLAAGRPRSGRHAIARAPS